MTNADRKALSRELLKSRARPKLLDRAKALATLSKVYVGTTNDPKVDMEIELILSHIMNPDIKEGYAVMVTGPSGAGKTTLVNQRLDETPELAPFDDGYGNEVQYCLRVVTPAGATVKTLGGAILEASGYPLKKLGDHGDLWLTVRNRLPLMMHQIIFFDEFQHVLKGPKAKGTAFLTDTIKTLMQNPDWPVWIIFAGVPQIEEFVERDEWLQMDRRVHRISIDDLIDPFDGIPPEKRVDIDPSELDWGDVENTRNIVKAMAESCDLQVAFPLTDEFVRRLMHGGIWRFGMTNQIIKMSIEHSLWDEDSPGELRLQHFVDGYRRISNCTGKSNVMLVDYWERIQRQVTVKNKVMKLTQNFSMRPE